MKAFGNGLMNCFRNGAGFPDTPGMTGYGRNPKQGKKTDDTVEKVNKEKDNRDTAYLTCDVAEKPDEPVHRSTHSHLSEKRVL